MFEKFIKEINKRLNGSIYSLYSIVITSMSGSENLFIIIDLKFTNSKKEITVAPGIITNKNGKGVIMNLKDSEKFIFEKIDELAKKKLLK